MADEVEGATVPTVRVEVVAPAAEAGSESKITEAVEELQETVEDLQESIEDGEDEEDESERWLNQELTELREILTATQSKQDQILTQLEQLQRNMNEQRKESPDSLSRNQAAPAVVTVETPATDVVAVVEEPKPEGEQGPASEQNQNRPTAETQPIATSPAPERRKAKLHFI
jgi:hypothetical protein